jgi:hypothetical protein
MQKLGTAATALMCFASVFMMFQSGILVPFLTRMVVAALGMVLFWWLARKAGFSDIGEYAVLIIGAVCFFFGDVALDRVGLSVVPLDLISNLSAPSQMTNWIVLGFLAMMGLYVFITLFKKQPELST